MAESIILKVRASHFKDAVFMSHDNCPVARATKEQLKVKMVAEGVFHLYIRRGRNWILYDHKRYDEKMFDRDMRKAMKAGSPNKIIRNLALTLRP